MVESILCVMTHVLLKKMKHDDVSADSVNPATVLYSSFLSTLSAVQLVLDAETVRMPSLPLSKEGVSEHAQGIYEICVCPSGKLFLSKAGRTSTCSENQVC